MSTAVRYRLIIRLMNMGIGTFAVVLVTVGHQEGILAAGSNLYGVYDLITT